MITLIILIILPSKVRFPAENCAVKMIIRPQGDHALQGTSALRSWWGGSERFDTRDIQRFATHRVDDRPDGGSDEIGMLHRNRMADPLGSCDIYDDWDPSGP